MRPLAALLALAFLAAACSIALPASSLASRWTSAEVEDDDALALEDAASDAEDDREIDDDSRDETLEEVLWLASRAPAAIEVFGVVIPWQHHVEAPPNALPPEHRTRPPISA